MEIEIKVKYKDKIIRNRKKITKAEIDNYTFGFLNLFIFSLEDIKNEIIKLFLDTFTEHGLSEIKNDSLYNRKT